MLQINIVLLLLLSLSSYTWACKTLNKPCKAWEVCYTGIGCVSIEAHIGSTTTQTLIPCFNVTINTLLTPSLRCIGSVSCNNNISQLCGKVIDIDRCHLRPLLNNPVAQQGGNISCPQSLPCTSTTGCFGSDRLPHTIFTCCGVRINLASTPSIQCLNFSSNCSCINLSTCPQIVETDLCHQAPIIPESPSSCVRQGELIQCDDNGIQACLPNIGCVTVPTISPPPSLISSTGPQTNNSDRNWLILFFVLYGLLVIITLLVISYFITR